MKRSHQMKTNQGREKVSSLLVVFLLLSACQPLVQPFSPEQENNPLIIATVEVPTATRTAIPSLTPETQAAQQPVEVNAGNIPQPFDPTGNSPMSPMEAMLLRSLELQITAHLPAHPQQVALYRRQPETLTEAGAVALFQQMGIDGSVHSRTAEAGNAIYTASDKNFTMNVNSDSPLHFGMGQQVSGAEAGSQPFEEREQLAKTFLQTHGLLDFPYRIEPIYGSYGQNYGVAIAEFIDGIPLYQGWSPWISIIFDSQGQPLNMVFQRLKLSPERQVAIRPVEAVWADLQSHRLEDCTILRILANAEWQGDPNSQKVVIDQIELAYFTTPTGGMWFGSNPADSPMRMMQPVWRFTGKLTDGTLVELLTEAKVNADPENTNPIEQAIKPAKDGESLPTGTVNANAGEDLVNVRSGPGAIYDQIGTLSVGQAVEVTGRSPHWEWWRIRAGGVEGWVYTAFLTVDSAAGIPCVEQQAGDCATSGLPPENDQAISRIQAFRSASKMNITYKGEDSNPNADLRKAFIYEDDQGSEYWVDQAALFVVQWTPKLVEPTSAQLSIDALRTQARNFAFQKSPRLAQSAGSLTFTENTKDGTTLAFRWEDRSVVGYSLFPFLQIILRADGQMTEYMNTLDVLSINGP